MNLGYDHSGALYTLSDLVIGVFSGTFLEAGVVMCTGFSPSVTVLVWSMVTHSASTLA